MERKITASMAMNSSTKITEPLTISEKAMLTQPFCNLPQYWCTACAKLSWMVTLKEADDILRLNSRSNYRMNQSQVRALSQGHKMKTSTGETLLCIKALSAKAF
jgi:hypothetical protein